MSQALLKTGRPIYFSLCEWGVENPAVWAPAIGNSWRTTGDIKDNWDSFVSILDQQVGLENYSGPGHWNDPDMLEVGNGGMTNDEYKAHFALWALLKAPLLIGCDLSNMTSETLEIIGNEEIIAINQDKLGIQGKRIFKDGDLEVWAGELENNEVAAVMFNRGTTNQTITVDFPNAGVKGRSADVRDLYQKKYLGRFIWRYEDTVAAHSVVVLKFSNSY